MKFRRVDALVNSGERWRLMGGGGVAPYGWRWRLTRRGGGGVLLEGVAVASYSKGWGGVLLEGVAVASYSKGWGWGRGPEWLAARIIFLLLSN
jgi:hypothetical protein